MSEVHTLRRADFCPTGICPRLALYCCLSSQYAILRLYFCFPVFDIMTIFTANIAFLILELDKSPLDKCPTTHPTDNCAEVLVLS